MWRYGEAEHTSRAGRALAGDASRHLPSSGRGRSGGARSGPDWRGARSSLGDPVVPPQGAEACRAGDSPARGTLARLRGQLRHHDRLDRLPDPSLLRWRSISLRDRSPDCRRPERDRMTTTIYHNPNCGTSRNVLALIRNSGEEPKVIEYLDTPPSRERLVDLIAAMGIPVRDLLRRKGTPYDELKLDARSEERR